MRNVERKSAKKPKEEIPFFHKDDPPLRFAPISHAQDKVPTTLNSC